MRPSDVTLVRDRLGPLAPGGEDLARRAPTARHQPAGVSSLDRVELELHRGHDAEAPAAAAQRPEQLGLVVGVGADVAAVGGDELDRGDAVGGEAVLAAEPADAAAERVADDADVRRGAGERGEAVGEAGAVTSAQIAPARDAGAAGLRVDLRRRACAWCESRIVSLRASPSAPAPWPVPWGRRAGRARARSRRPRPRRRRSAGSATAAGRWSTARFQARRASSQPASPGPRHVAVEAGTESFDVDRGEVRDQHAPDVAGAADLAHQGDP